MRQMVEMSGTQALRDDHRVISCVLTCFGLTLQQARANQRVEKSALAPFLEFFRDYADRNHHLKEEDHLFQCLKRCSNGDVLQKMETLSDEHERGRRRVSLIAENLDDAETGDTFATEFILDQGLAFHDLLKGHIAAEDLGLFNVADTLLRGDQLAELLSHYEEAGTDPQYQARKARGLDLADQICRMRGKTLDL